MPQQRGDRFEGHAPVDGLGGEGVAQLMRGDAAEAGLAGDLGDGAIDPRRGDPASVVGEQVVGAQGVAALGEPVVEEGFELGVQRDVAIAVQLADGHPQPVGRADLDYGVDGQVNEFAAAQASAGEDLHAEADKGVGVGPRRAEQFGRRRVVEEARQGPIDDGVIAGEK